MAEFLTSWSVQEDPGHSLCRSSCPQKQNQKENNFSLDRNHSKPSLVWVSWSNVAQGIWSAVSPPILGLRVVIYT